MEKTHLIQMDLQRKKISRTKVCRCSFIPKSHTDHLQMFLSNTVPHIQQQFWTICRAVLGERAYRFIISDSQALESLIPNVS